MPNVTSQPPASSTADAVPTVAVPTVGEKKLWRLRVLKGAPFASVTLAGHTFHLYTEPVIPDKNADHGYRREYVEGIIEPLLDREVTAIRSEMKVTYVRWENRLMKIARVFKPTALVPMDSSTDERVERYLRMEPAEHLPGTVEVETDPVASE